VKRLLAALALTIAATGCTGGGEDAAGPSASPTPSESSPSSKPPVAKPPPAPPERACYRMAYAQALAPTTAAGSVKCTQPHTSVTYDVGTISAVVDGHLLAIDSDRVQAQVAGTCPRRLPAFLGGTADDLHLSMLRSVWFTPTVEDSDAGADWFRCDVIAVAGNDSLAQLKPGMGGVLGTEAGRDQFGMCGTAQPGTEDFARVICSRAHSWRAIQVVHFSEDRYPGPAAAREAGQAPCEDAGRGAASDALDYTWGYEWPTKEQWDGGQHYGLCWVPD
jgi:hypothetical protein